MMQPCYASCKQGPWTLQKGPNCLQATGNGDGSIFLSGTCSRTRLGMRLRQRSTLCKAGTDKVARSPCLYERSNFAAKTSISRNISFTRSRPHKLTSECKCRQHFTSQYLDPCVPALCLPSHPEQRSL